jgi:hypothetical protein
MENDRIILTHEEKMDLKGKLKQIIISYPPQLRYRACIHIKFIIDKDNFY